MASTYSNLKLQLMTTGENSGTWGNVTNINLGTALEEAIVGSADVTFSSGTVTLTLTDSNATQTARNMRLNLTGTSGGAQNLIVPAIEKIYVVNNGCADAITIKNSTGTGIAVPAGKTMWVYNNGTNVVDVVTYLTSLTLGSALPIASGGTGSTSTTYCNLQSNVTGTLPVANGGTGVTSSTGTGSVVLSASPTFTGTPIAPTASVGTDSTQVATTAFVRDIIPTGIISMWYGSLASVPSGWYLCDGTNGTPDLRDRFVVGAGSTYAVAATGGSATVTPAGTISGTVGGTSLTEAQMPKHYHLMLGPNSVSSPQGSGSGVGVYGGGTPDDGTQAYGTYSTGGDAASGTQTTGTASGDSHTHSFSGTFTGTSGTNLPPYYALAYIMKA